MMVQLPRCLASMAGCCSKELHRYGGTTCVRVIDQDGIVRVEATDGRQLIVVQVPSAEEFPTEDLHPEIKEVLIPAKDWVDAFKTIKPLRGVGDRGLCLVANDTEYKFDGYGASKIGKVGEGRFPETGRIFPDKTPACRFSVDPAVLTSLMAAIAPMRDPQSLRVDVLFWGDGEHMAVCTQHPTAGICADGVFVPLKVEADKDAA